MGLPKVDVVCATRGTVGTSHTRNLHHSGGAHFASGAVGLVDEVIFFKYLSLAFGATAHASSAVLVAFMGGLALGATAAARFDARIARPLLVYGVLRDRRRCRLRGVAVAVLVGRPFLRLDGRRDFIAGGSRAVRGGLAAAVVLLPTVAMGATLPLVARVAGATEGGAGEVATLYAANTAGGALGSLLGAYAIIPALGLSTSLRAGALVSVVIGLTAMMLSRERHEAPRSASLIPVPENRTEKALNPASDSQGRGVMLAVAASGLLVFASEVVFIDLLALVDGTSVYVFGLVLAVFLVALGLGAGASRILARRAGPNALAASLALSGLMLAATMPLWDRLPDFFVAAGPLAPLWWEREVVRGLVAALAIGLPAACMGMTFPLVLGLLAPSPDRGARTGRATAVNTLASVAGSLLAGFVLLPALGSQRACGVIALAYAAAAMLVPAPGRRWIGAIAMATGVVVVAVPRWDLARLSSGNNVYFQRQPEQGQVMWINEDLHGGVVTVTRAGDITTLWTNGKYQGDTGWQMAPQRGFADIPAMFLPRFERALVVGVGTGVTVQQTATYPFRSIDVAELSPGIVEAARRYFGRVNGGVFDDPRVHVRLEDGRNLLVVEKSRYDLVTVELTSIWFAGAANLYNREFYEVAASKLSDGGVLSQWIQLHHTTLREVASQMATARAVFAHAAFFIRGQGVLVLSGDPARARRHRPGRSGPRRRDDGRLRGQRLRAGRLLAGIADLHRRQSAARVRDPPQQCPGQRTSPELADYKRPEVAARVRPR